MRIAAAIAIAALACPLAEAQTRDNFGRQQQPIGGGTALGQAGQGGAFGNQQLGGQGQFGGQGQLGNQAGVGGQNAFGQFGQQGFVGRDAEDVRRGFQNLRGRDRRRALFDFAFESINELRESRRRRRERRRQPPPVRVQLRAAFSYPELSGSETAPAIQAQLSRVLADRGLGDAEVVVENRVATLWGQVRTEHDRQLIEQLVALEPGVSSVENLLSVRDE